MWNNLRARHYSVLILLTIVGLETSAIMIDRFMSKKSDVAFAMESSDAKDLLSGEYLYKLESRDFFETKKIVLMK